LRPPFGCTAEERSPHGVATPDAIAPTGRLLPTGNAPIFVSIANGLGLVVELN